MKRRLKAGKRRNSGFSLNVLTDDECNEIHLATLDVLKHTGVFVEHEEALEVLDGGGCLVDRKNKVVKFPHWVVEDAIRMAPSTFYAYGRRPEDDVVLEDNRVTFTNFGEGIMFVDPVTGEHRETTKADIIKAARIIDSLEHIETYERAMCSHDKPPEVQAIHNAEASLTNTTKHHWLGPVNGYQADKVIDICTAIVGSQEEFRKRPLLSFATCPISPLKLPGHHSEIVMKAAKNGMGVLIIGMAMSGGSSPVHLAGTLVIQNCEILSTLVLNQLTRKGSPFVYGTSTCPMDLRMATATVGSPETGMISAAVARLAKYYSLPSFVAGG
ncbi:MAG: trimethylamine methyltransferase family protein [Desulfobacterales bacterium]|nr:MAG: trimethylamine methyltransferase family protein [Desulfobacterales bacterium]